MFVPEVIAKTGQLRGIVEGQSLDSAAFPEIDCLVAGNGGTSAVADKHNFLSGGPHPYKDIQSLAHAIFNHFPLKIGDSRLDQKFGDLFEPVRSALSAGY